MGTLTKKEQSTRPPKKLIERLRAFTTPELCDGAGLYHSMDYQIKPWIGRTKIVGPAVTVDVPSGEGFWAAGKQFFRRNPDGFQGKIAPSSGQKARRLGMSTFFKQALGIKIQKCGGHPWRLE